MGGQIPKRAIKRVAVSARVTFSVNVRVEVAPQLSVAASVTLCVPVGRALLIVTIPVAATDNVPLNVAELACRFVRNPLSLTPPAGVVANVAPAATFAVA